MDKKLIGDFIEVLRGKEGVLSFHLKKETEREPHTTSEDYYLVLEGSREIKVPLGILFYDEKKGADSTKDRLVEIKGNLLDIIAALEGTKGLKGEGKLGIEDYAVVDHSGLISHQATPDNPIHFTSAQMVAYYTGKLPKICPAKPVPYPA